MRFFESCLIVLFVLVICILIFRLRMGLQARRFSMRIVRQRPTRSMRALLMEVELFAQGKSKDNLCLYRLRGAEPALAGTLSKLWCMEYDGRRRRGTTARRFGKIQPLPALAGEVSAARLFDIDTNDEKARILTRHLGTGSCARGGIVIGSVILLGGRAGRWKIDPASCRSAPLSRSSFRSCM